MRESSSTVSRRAFIVWIRARFHGSRGDPPRRWLLQRLQHLRDDRVVAKAKLLPERDGRFRRRRPTTALGYKTDYTVTIPISGQAQLDFYTIDGDHHQVTNNGTMTVANVKTAQPYNGNFL